MTHARSTELAAIYREAATLLVTREECVRTGCYSCLALAVATDPENYTGNADGPNYRDFDTVKAYLAMYPEIEDGLPPTVYDYGSGLDFRLTALCFMAAMVEAGDA